MLKLKKREEKFMKQNVFKKSVATLIMALILIVALLVGFTLTKKAYAEMVIWEKI